jgi:hypothetical protein
VKIGLVKTCAFWPKYNLKSIHADYIYHKNEKGKTCQTDLPLLKDDITKILRPQKPVIYSIYSSSSG